MGDRFSGNSVAKDKPLDFIHDKKRRMKLRQRLKELGLNDFELSRSEAKYLPDLLNEGEEVGGVIAGRSHRGHVMFVATDSRVIILDCKPLFKDSEEITYYVVAGVTTGSIGLLHSVTLHTKLGDFKLKTFYAKAAKSFSTYINSRCIEKGTGENLYD